MKQTLLILALLLLAPYSASGGELALLTHNLGSQGYADPDTGELRGRIHAGKRAFNVELVRTLKRMLDLDTPIREVVYAEGMQRLGGNGEVAFFNIYRTPQREHLYKWVGPLQREVDYLYGLDGTRDMKSLRDARDASICVVSGSMHHVVLASQGFANLRTEETYAACFALLHAGEVSLAVSSDETVAQKLHEAGIPASAAYCVPEPVVQSAGYIAFSRNVDDAVVRQWQEAFNSLVGSGLYQELYDRYYTK